MTVSLQVLYPTKNGTSFDHEYFAETHMPIVAKYLGPHIDRTSISRGLSGGPDAPAGYHAIATMTFADQAALQSALAEAGPALEDIPNFFSGQPQMLVGEVIV